MDEYLIKETYTLPSLGKIYPVVVNPEITLRSMTTTDEMERLSNSSKPYKQMSELIDRCIVGEKPGISVYDMCLGDYQYLLHRLRVVTYGSEYKMSCQCPYCKLTTTETIDLDEMPVKIYTEDFNKELEFDLPKTKKHIKLRYQTPRMLDMIEEKTSELKKKSNGKDRGLVISLQYLIDTIDGSSPNPIVLEDFLNNLPMADANVIFKHAAKINSLIGLETEKIEVECEVCGNNYTTRFRQTGEFFGPSIDT